MVVYEFNIEIKIFNLEFIVFGMQFRFWLRVMFYYVDFESEVVVDVMEILLFFFNLFSFFS